MRTIRQHMACFLFFGLGPLALAVSGFVSAASAEPESFAPLGDAGPPTSVEALWEGYDPQAEPLEIEVLKEWEEDGVVLRVVRFRVGVFKGERAMLAGVYGFPKGGSALPGLLQIHGGGQFADYRAVLANARRGYATLSIAWAGRISAPGYRVGASQVKLYWDGMTQDPGYRVTTDWGAVDGYHAPRRFDDSPGFPSLRPASHTLDPVESPRNSGWFLSAVGARRGLTFLEQQPEVDPEKLGVYGHSMGGKLTVLTAGTDSRVKAAAPSCGGISDRDNDPLFDGTLSDDASLKNIRCPIVFLMPANDFHGRIDDLPAAIREIQSEQVRMTCSPHLSHRDTPEHEAATLLWFDEHLKQTFTFPQTPTTRLHLDTRNHVPFFTVRPDPSRKIRTVEIFYTQQGRLPDEAEDRENTKHRYWHPATVSRHEDQWRASLPLIQTDEPLWVYANVIYELDEPVSGVGYYYSDYTAQTLAVSSEMTVVLPSELAEAGVEATAETSRLIESFQGDWQRGWFTHDAGAWSMRTNKVYDPRWAAPGDVLLALDVRSQEANTLVIGIDGYVAEVPLVGGNDWQTVQLAASDFTDAAGEKLEGWRGIHQLRFAATETLRSKDRGRGASRQVGGAWKGDPSAIFNLRWADRQQSELPERPQRLGLDEAALLDVFPPASFAADQPGRMRLSETMDQPTPGPWMEGLDERAVFQASMKHEQGPLNSYELRMGVGGQIYSLQGAFGESVPPSWRANGATSPWNDEVWQFVAVCTRYNLMHKDRDWLAAAAPYQAGYFIHNSGCYMADAAPGSDLKNLYCPLLATDYDPQARAYRQLNWGLVPQMRTIHRSPLLYYTQVRDLGEGVIEMTWVIHNFSTRDDIVFDHLNAPWGGTRLSSLPLTYVATPEGELALDQPEADSEGRFANGTDVRNTGGYTLSSVEDRPDSPALALVYGLDKHREAQAQRQRQGLDYVQFRPSLYRSWRASGPRYQRDWKDFQNIPPNTFRNYQVIEVIPKLQLRPQSTIWYRSYLVVAGKDRCQELAAELVDHVDYGGRSFAARDTPLVDVPATGSAKAFRLYAQPVQGTLPVFAVRHKPTGTTLYTTDPYHFTPQENLDLPIPEDHKDFDYFSNSVGYTLDGQTEFLGLLGYGYIDNPDEGSWVPLSEVAGEMNSGFGSTYDLNVWVKAAD